MAERCCIGGTYSSDLSPPIVIVTINQLIFHIFTIISRKFARHITGPKIIKIMNLNEKHTLRTWWNTLTHLIFEGMLELRIK
jgi:hypothetical protein